MPIRDRKSASVSSVLCGIARIKRWCSYEWHVLQPFDRWFEKVVHRIDA